MARSWLRSSGEIRGIAERYLEQDSEALLMGDPDRIDAGIDWFG
jgi:hypothetical protein